MDYWKECIESAFDEAKITATTKQIEEVVDFVKVSHENYSLYSGEECIPNPLETENKRLSEELKIEKNKVICPKCNGTGRIISYGPYHSAESDCWECKGEGLIKQ